MELFDILKKNCSYEMVGSNKIRVIDFKHCVLDETITGSVEISDGLFVNLDNCLECEDCGTWFCTDYGDNIAVCGQCAEGWDFCDECGTLERLDSGLYHDDYFYCSDCVDNLFVATEYSGELVLRTDAIYVEMYGYISVDDYTYGDFFQCPGCGLYYCLDDGCYCDNDDEYYCYDCYDNCELVGGYRTHDSNKYMYGDAENDNGGLKQLASK